MVVLLANCHPISVFMHEKSISCSKQPIDSPREGRRVVALRSGHILPRRKDNKKDKPEGN